MASKPDVKVACVQAAPFYFDLDRSIEKGIGLIEEAARNGARLIAFPEVWLPGYPFFFWLGAPIEGLAHIPGYRDNSLVIGSEQDLALRRAAADNGIFVCMGYSELSGSSLYMGQMLLSPQGEPRILRRKLKPTLAERCVFGEGDGSHLQVAETEIGRVGALNCWEHLQPLLKYAMYAQNEAIHVAAWPCLSLYKGKSYALGPEMTWATSQIYALEGQCYVLAATQVATPELVAMLCDTPLRRELLPIGGGCSMIFGPDGAPLCEPIPEDREGILYAEVDFAAIGIAKTAADPAGHYARPDVARLLLNTTPAHRILPADAFVHTPPAAGPRPTCEEADPDA
ncbi:carbon-nitrogen hydrolase family protein [Solidesulfovibrio sp.]|uniref:carbon-nitrogen hydrolase family protein n=1 Tax=Solidesulfovibrio sp. TaxID=2910990 RepID=UPI002608BF09|nr:carbon-nitrogen hydrolase family protein [Solidesulfovibrio sp.]